MSRLKRLIGNSTIYKWIKKLIIDLTYYLPISPQKVVFDNFGGRGYGDDPKYIAEELRKRNLGLKLIWVTSNMNLEFPKGIKKVKYGTIRAAYHWSTAKVWVDNIKSSIKVKKKSEQYYIQTWHSTLGFKKNEQDAKTLPEKYVLQAKEDAARTDLMYSNNDFRVDKYKKCFWYEGEVIKCDVPRLSVLYNVTDELKQQVKKQLCINESQKIVLYAPTFRKVTDISVYEFEYENCIKSLEERFKGEFVMLIRLHPNESQYGKRLNVYDGIKIFNVSDYPDMQELLAVSDVLITDYSGSMFDFCLTKKPVFLLAKDYERYIEADREVYFKLNELPFSLSCCDEELQNNIHTFSESEYSRACNAFFNQIGFEEEGNGARVIADLIISKMA